MLCCAVGRCGPLWWAAWGELCCSVGAGSGQAQAYKQQQEHREEGVAAGGCLLLAPAPPTFRHPLHPPSHLPTLQGLAGRPILYRGMLDCIRQVLRKEGLGGFYSASLPSYLKVAPSIGCMYFLFELIMSRPLGQPPPAALALVAAAAPPQPAAAAVECSAGGRR